MVAWWTAWTACLIFTPPGADWTSSQPWRRARRLTDGVPLQHAVMLADRIEQQKSSGRGRGGKSRLDAPGRSSIRGSGRGRTTGRASGRGIARGNGRGSNGRGRSGANLDLSQPVPDRVLTSLLTKSNSPEDLIKLFEFHGAVFNQVHISAFWNTMGKHVKRHPRNMRYLKARLRDSPEIFESARMQTIRMLPSIGARELSNVAHGKSQEDARRRLWPERRFIASHNMNQRSAPHHPCAQHRSIFLRVGCASLRFD